MSPLLLSLLLAVDTTPQSTIQAFVDALNAGDLRAMARQVDGKIRTDLPTPSPSFGKAEAKVTIGAVNVQEDDAYAEVDLEFTNGPGEKRETKHDRVHLHRTDGDWKIVPLPVPGSANGITLSLIATIVTDNPAMGLARQAAVKSRSLSNVKVLAVATIMYAQDHGDRYPTAAHFRAAVSPYLRRMKGPYPKGPEVFDVPGAKGMVYFLDPRLSGRPVSSIGPIAEVAMIVLGKANRAAFPYNGKTVLGYADGHVAQADPPKVYRARTIPLG